MADFEPAFKKTLHFEGGYANDAADHGGKTMYGITEAVARGYGYKGEMRSLPLDFAKKIYKSGYWDVNQLDRFPQLLAENVFDCGVNCGVTVAAKMLQKVVGVTVDGIIGGRTLRVLGEILSEHGEKALIFAYLDEREAKYKRICAANPSQNKFLKGWLLRCRKLRGEMT
jgi:lysozyme family protein